MVAQSAKCLYFIWLMKWLETRFLSFGIFKGHKTFSYDYVWPEVNSSGQHLKIFVYNWDTEKT